MRTTHLTRTLTVVESAGDACVPWPAHRDPRGYGRTGHQGRPGRLAHRVVYELLVGPIPEGLTLDHSCFEPACVNPAHLSPAGLVANSKRQRSAAKAFCVNGHERTPENSIYRTGNRARQGVRYGRICNRDSVRAYKARKRRTAA